MNIKDVGGALVSKTATLAGLLLLPAMGGRLLNDSQEFGTYMLIIGMVALIAMISQMGMNTVLLTRVGENRKKQVGSSRLIRETQRRLLLVSLLVAVIGCVWLASVCKASGRHLQGIECIAVFLMFVLASQQLLLGDVFRGHAKNSEGNFYGEALAIILASTGFCLLLLKAGTVELKNILFVHVIAYVAAAIVGQVKLSGIMKSGTEKEMAMDVGKIGYFEGLAISFAAVGILLVNQIGLSLAAWMEGAAAAGTLAIAQRTGILVLLPNMFMNGIIAHRIVELKIGGDSCATEKFIKQCWQILAVCSMTIAMPLWLFPDWVVQNVFGSKTDSMIISVVMILVLGRLIAVLCGISGSVLALYGRYSDVLIGAVGALVVSCVLMIVLGLYAGLAGIAVGLIAGSIWQNVSQMLYVKKLLGFWPVGVKT